MAINALQLYSQQSNGVTFCDPLDPDMFVRFKTTANQKVLDGQRVQNFITEITANHNHSITVGGAVVNDALSIRLRTSGSLLSVPRLKQMLNDLVAKVTAWEDENVLIGFAPSTAPQNTVS